MPHVVVIGGGFAGARAVERLTRRDARDRVRVTVIDRTNHHTFAPLLYQVATAGLSPQDVAHSLRALYAIHPNVSVRLGAVEGIDLERRQLVLDHGEPVSYDQLIVAPGAVTADYGVPGVAEHALPLKTVGDAVTIRNHVLRRFEEAATDPDVGGELTIVIAGGGPTGVELAGAMAELSQVLLGRDFAELAGCRVRVVLVERLDTLLPGFAATSRTYAQRMLERNGVELRLGVGIQRVLADRVELDDGSSLPTRTLIWAAGVRANPLVGSLRAPVDRSGRVVVSPDLTVEGHPEIFVVGDAALIHDPGGVPVPQVAPAAMQMGHHAAEQVLRRLNGLPTEHFRYRNKGSMATIGRNAAVNEYPGRVRVRGRVAWLAWLFLHLLYLAGGRNRLSALLTWSWSYVTFDRGLRVVFDPPRPDSITTRSAA